MRSCTVAEGLSCKATTLRAWELCCRIFSAFTRHTSSTCSMPLEWAQLAHRRALSGCIACKRCGGMGVVAAHSSPKRPVCRRHTWCRVRCLRRGRPSPAQSWSVRRHAPPSRHRCLESTLTHTRKQKQYTRRHSHVVRWSGWHIAEHRRHSSPPRIEAAERQAKPTRQSDCWVGSAI